MDATDKDQGTDLKIYEQKHRSLQKFVPMLKKCIDRFNSQQPMPPDKLSYLTKIEKVYEILTDPSKKVKLEMLDKFEGILLKMAPKVEMNAGNLTNDLRIKKEVDYSEMPIKKEPADKPPKNSYLDLITPDSPPVTSTLYHHSPIEIPTERSDGKDTNSNSKYHRGTSSPSRYDKNRNKYDYNDRRYDRDDRRYERDERREDRRRDRDYRYTDRDDRHQSESRRDRDDRRDKRDRRIDDRHDRRSDSTKIKSEPLDGLEDWSNDSNTLAYAIKMEAKKSDETKIMFNPASKPNPVLKPNPASKPNRHSSNHQKHDKPKHNEKQSVFNRLGTKVDSTRSPFDLPPSPPLNSQLNEMSPAELTELLANNEDRFGSSNDDIKRKELDALYAMRDKIQSDLERSKKSTYDPKQNEFLWGKSAITTATAATAAVDNLIPIPSTSSLSKTNLTQAAVAAYKPPVKQINPAIEQIESIRKTSNDSITRKPSSDKPHHKHFSFANEFKSLGNEKVTPFEIKSLQKPLRPVPPDNPKTVVRPEKLKTPMISQELLDSLPAEDDTIYEVVKQAIASTIQNKSRALSPTAALAVQKVIPSTLKSNTNTNSKPSPMSPPDPFINHAGHSENVRLAYKYNPKPRPRTTSEEQIPEIRNITIATPRCNNEAGNRPISNGYNIPSISNNDPRLRNRDPRVPAAISVDLNQPLFPSAPGFQRDMFSSTVAPFNDPFGNTPFANTQMRSHFQGAGVHHPPNISPQYAQSPNSHVGLSPLGGLTSPPMNQFQPFSANVPKVNHPPSYPYSHSKDTDQNKNQSSSFNNWYPPSDSSNKPPATDNCHRTYGEYRRSKQNQAKSVSDKVNPLSKKEMPKSQLDYVYSSNNYAATPTQLKATGDKFKIPKIHKTASSETENKKKSPHEVVEKAANLSIQENGDEDAENWDAEIETYNLEDSNDDSDSNDSDQETVEKILKSKRLRQHKQRENRKAKKATNKPAVVVSKTPEIQSRDPRLNRSKSNSESTKINGKTEKPIAETVPLQDDTIKTTLEGYLMNMLNPSNFGKEHLLSMLGKVLEENKFNQIKKIVNNDDSESKPEENTTNLKSPEKPDLVNHDSDAKNTEAEEDDEESISLHHADPIVTKKAKKPKPKRKNELQKLNEDIRTMFISNGVLTATGRRMCTVIKENETPPAPVHRNFAKKKTTVRPAPRPSTPVVEKVETPEPERKVQPLRILKRRMTMAATSDIHKEWEINKDYNRRDLENQELTLENIWQPRLPADDCKGLSDNEELLTPLREETVVDPKPKRIKNRRKSMVVVPGERRSARLTEMAQNAEIKHENSDNESTLKPPERCASVDRKVPDKNTSIHIDGPDEQDTNDSCDSTEFEVEPRSKSQERKSVRRNKCKWASGVLPKKKKKVRSGEQKNTNPDHHILNTAVMNRCLLCKFTGHYVVHHYVQKHRNSEVFVSRLPPEVADALRDPTVPLPLATRKMEKISGLCLFCQTEKDTQAHCWRNHFTSHTGEFEITCSGCNRPMRNLSFNSHKCTSENRVAIRNPTFEFGKTNFEVSICNLCNYTQFSNDRVIDHLKKQHGIENTENQYIKVNLLKSKRKKKPTAKQKKTENMPESSKSVVSANACPVQDNSFSSEVEMPILKPQKPLAMDIDSPKKSDESYNSDAFIPPSKTDDTLFDDDTMKMMSDSFNTSHTLNHQPRRSIADRLNERFKSVNAAEEIERESEKETEKESDVPQQSNDPIKEETNTAQKSLDDDLTAALDKEQILVPIILKNQDGECEDEDNQSTSQQDKKSAEAVSNTELAEAIETITNNPIEDDASSCAPLSSVDTNISHSSYSIATDKELEHDEQFEETDNLDDNEWESCSSDSDIGDMPTSLNAISRQRNKKNNRIYDTVSRLYKSISSEKLKKEDKNENKAVNEGQIPLPTVIKKDPEEATNTELPLQDANSADQSAKAEEQDDFPAPVSSVPLELPVGLKPIEDNASLIDTVVRVPEQSVPSDEAHTKETNETATKVTEVNATEPNATKINPAETISTETNPTESNSKLTFEEIVREATRNDDQTQSGTKTSSRITIRLAGYANSNGNMTMSNNDNGIQQNGRPDITNTMNQSIVKVINRIDNIGYSNWNNEIGYCCLIDTCGFETTVLTNLLYHIENHDNLWSGYCFMCDRPVNTDERPLIVEFKHMTETHLDKRKNEVVEMASGQKPLLKFRRLSGDKLSTNKQQVPNTSKARPDFEIIKVDSLATTQQPSVQEPFLKISSVVGGIPNQPIVKPIVISNIVSLSPPPNLKPWTKTSTIKPSNICEKMLRDISLFSLYKCMGTNCFFSTGDSENMLFHLRNHETQIESNTNKDMDTSSWLECAYCEEIADSCQVLVKHIQDEHSSSIFQCPYCFYRACAAHNVLIHLKQYHTDEPFVFVCNGKLKLMSNEFPFIFKSRGENVRALNCGKECDLSFFVMQIFVDHLASTPSHKEVFTCQFCQLPVLRTAAAKHMLCHGIGLFECIYCLFGTNSVENIRLHMCNLHPTKLLYVCVRLLRKDKDLSQVDICSIDSTVLAHIGQPVDKNLFHRCPYSDEQLNFMSPSLVAKNINTMDPTVAIPMPKPRQNIETATNLEIVDINSGATESFPNNEIENRAMGTSNLMLNNIPSLGDLEKSYSIDDYDKYFEKLDLAAANVPKMDEIAMGKIPGGSNLIISNVVGGVLITEDERSNVITTDISRPSQLQDEIDKAAYALVKGTGLEGTDLYRCGMPECDGAGADAIYFNVHLLKHTYSGQKGYKCYHCSLMSKNIVGLKYHIKVHGIHRYFCYYCDFTGPIMNYTLKHMNDTHKKIQVVTIPLNPRKNDQNKDMFVICPRGLRHEELNRFGLKLLERYKHIMATTKKFYAPDETDLLPRQSIFNELLYCSVCQFSTKVRLNLYRHLEKHRNKEDVGKQDPINPVPCLNTGEKHFDKMINLAGSSNNNQPPPSQAVLYAFIGELRRFVCGAKGCRYQTINESMLRSHLNTLHSNEEGYRCPHCNIVICANKLDAEEIVHHLRMHDTKLFRCPRCLIIHYNKNLIQKHIEEKHPGCKEGIVSILRDEKSNQEPSTSEVPKVHKWQCTLCFETFNLRSQIQQHVQNVHSISYQYQCDICSELQSNAKSVILEHMNSKHSDSAKRVKFFYTKIECTDTTPIWRRDDPNKIKHIRGILLDDEESTTAAESEASTASSNKKRLPRKKKTATRSSQAMTATSASLPVNTQSVIATQSSSSAAETAKATPTATATRTATSTATRTATSTATKPATATAAAKATATATATATVTSTATKTTPAPVAAVKPSNPAAVKSSNPAAVKSSKPAAVKSSKPAAGSNATNEDDDSDDVEIINPVVETILIDEVVISDDDDSPSNTPSTTVAPAKPVKPKLEPKSSAGPIQKVTVLNDRTEESPPYACGTCKSFSGVTVASVRIHHMQKHDKQPFTVYILREKNKTVAPAAAANNTYQPGKQLERDSTPPQPSTPPPFDKNILYICFHCIFKSTNLNEIYNHWKESHKHPKKTSNNIVFPGRSFCFKITKSVTCFYCNKSGSYNDIKLHNFRAHHGVVFASIDAADWRKCGECNFCYENDRDEIRQHYETEHSMTSYVHMRAEPVDYLNDEFLDKVFETGYKGEHECEYCGVVCKYVEDYDEHHKTNHKTEPQKFKIIPARIEYGCPTCRETMYEELAMVKHIREHGMLYQCKFCEKTFQYLKMIKQHHEIMHKVKDETYRNVDVMSNIELYLAMRITFPNGLVLTKGDAKNTKYGNINEVIEHVQKLNEDELEAVRQRQEKEFAEMENSAAKEHERLQEAKMIKRYKGPGSTKRPLKQETKDDDDFAPKKRRPTKKKIVSSSSDEDNDDNFDDEKPLVKRITPSSNRSFKRIKTESPSSEDEPLSKLKMTEYSFYGQKPKPLDLHKIYTYMNVSGADMRVSCNRFAMLLNINPNLKLDPIRSMEDYEILKKKTVSKTKK